MSTSHTSHESHTTPPSRPHLRRGSLAALGVGLVSALMLALSVPFAASAAPELPGDSGWARFGHFAPEESAVDVFVDGQPFVSDVVFKTVSQYMPLPAGPHQFEVREAGASGGDPILQVDAGVPDGSSVTIGAVSTRDGLAPQVYTDQLVQPAPDSSLVRFIHAAPQVQAVDVTVVDGPTLATDVPYPAATDYQAVAPGTYNVEVKAAGTDDVVLRVNGWKIDPGTQASIVIVEGADGKIDVAPVQDSVAVAAAPAGGIQTGGGAMADVLDPLPGNGSSADGSTNGVTSGAFIGLVVVVAAGAGAGAEFLRRRRWS